MKGVGIYLHYQLASLRREKKGLKGFASNLPSNCKQRWRLTRFGWHSWGERGLDILAVENSHLGRFI